MSATHDARRCWATPGSGRFTQRALDEGAELLCGREPYGPTRLGLPPHVLTAGNDVATAREGVFGPVMTIIRADDESDALRLANDTPYGWSSAVFGGDVERGVRFAWRIDAAMTHINDSPVNDDAGTASAVKKPRGKSVSAASGPSMS